MNNILRLQQWYESQCDGDWEHSYGVSITTLDNPGWLVRIDLIETPHAAVPFDPVQRGDSEEGVDWVSCERDQAKFTGAGGRGNLDEILALFLAWVERPLDAG